MIDLNASHTKRDVIVDQLLKMVETLPVGEPIPAERRLSEEFGVARMTVRVAIDGLVREGWLERRRGSGTFVAQPRIAQPLTLTSFSHDMRLRGMQPASRSLRVRTRKASPRIGKELKISPGTGVVVISRVRLADGVPMAIETAHLPSYLVPGLTAELLKDSSLYALLESRYQVRITEGEQSVEATVVDEQEASLLEVPAYSPAFLIERTTWDEKQRIEYTRSIYRGDRYRLLAHLHRGTV